MRKIALAKPLPHQKVTSRVNGGVDIAKRKVLDSSASFGRLALAWSNIGLENIQVIELYQDYVMGEGVNDSTLQIALKMQEVAGHAFYHELLHDSGVHDLYIYAVCWVAGVISEKELGHLLPMDKFLVGILALPILNTSPKQQNFFDPEEH